MTRDDWAFVRFLTGMYAVLALGLWHNGYIQ